MRNKNLSLFLYSQILSSFGYNLLNSAIVYHVLDLTGSSSKFATSMLVGLLSKAAFLPLAGFISDMFDKRRAFVSVDLAFSLIVFCVLIFSLKYHVGYGILSAFYFVTNALRTISQPITKSTIPAIVNEETLLHANSYEVSNDKLARIFGPVLALSMLALFGFEVAMFISLVLYLITAYLKSQIEIVQEKIVYKGVSLLEIFRNLREGFYVTFSHKSVALLLANAVLTQIFFHSFVYTIFPIVLYGLEASEVLSIMKTLSFLNMKHASIWKSLNAWIQLGGAVGVMFSIFYISKIKGRFSEKIGIPFGIFGTSLSGFLISGVILYFKNYGISTLSFINLVTLLNVPMFFSMNIFTIFFSVYYQKRIDKSKLGRFSANFLFLFAIASALGTYAYGQLAQMGWSYPVAFLLTGSLLKVLLYFVSIRYERFNT